MRSIQQQHADVFAGRPVRRARAPEVALKVLRDSTPTCSEASIDLAATYTDAFVDKVPAR